MVLAPATVPCLGTVPYSCQTQLIQGGRSHNKGFSGWGHLSSPLRYRHELACILPEGDVPKRMQTEPTSTARMVGPRGVCQQSTVKPGGGWHSPHRLVIGPCLSQPKSVSMATASSLPIIFILKDSHPSCLSLGSLPSCHTSPRIQIPGLIVNC